MDEGATLDATVLRREAHADGGADAGQIGLRMPSGQLACHQEIF
jgi:hypothetical protein